MKLFLKYLLLSVIIITVNCSFVSAGIAPWEWQNPLPTGSSLQSVWGSSETDVFAVGGDGAILHFDGVSWAEMPNEFTDQFFGVWGSSANDVFVVGDNGAIVHYNGSSWTRMNSNTENDFREVWGFSANDVYAVGFGGTIVHYNGASWSLVDIESTLPTNNFGGVWGDSVSGELFVVGSEVIAHYNGTAWTLSEFTDVFLSDVWGASNTDVFAVGSSGVILHFDGNSWIEMEHNIPEYSSNGYLSFSRVWGSSGNNVFAFAVNRILHYSGGSWTEMSIEGTSYSYFYGAWGSSDNDIHAVGHQGVMLHYNGSVWSEKTPVTKNGFRGVGGSSATDVYAAGLYGTILRYDGSQWSDMNSGSSETFSDVWSSSVNDVYAVGGEILHYSGNSWEKLTIGSGTGNSVWGSGSNDVFIVGGAGRILHYNGTSWSDITIGTDSLQSVWGSAGDDVYAVGYAGTILHYNGAGWEALSNVTDYDLTRVSGSSANNIYVVGRQGNNKILLHYDGSSWQSVSIAIPGVIIGSIYDVWCSSEDDVYVLDFMGAVYHYNGNTWSEVMRVDIECLNAIWGSSGKDVFAVGDSGAIIHYIRKSQIQTVQDLHGNISPQGPVSVDYGGEQTFTIAPDDGYHTIDVKIDGVSEGIVDSYRFENVIAAHEISAVFGRNTLKVPVITYPENSSILSTLNPEIVVSNTLDPGVPDKSYYIEVYLPDRVTPVVASPAVLQGAGSTTWQPGNDILKDNTSYSLRVRVHDGIGYSSWSGFVDFQVNAINDSPVINVDGPLSMVVDEDASVTENNISATDADGDSISWAVNTAPEHGEVLLGGTGTHPVITYTPVAHYHGNDSFVLRAFDGIDGMDTLAVNVVVYPLNRPPTVPVVSFPANGSIVSTKTPELQVNNSTDSDGHSLSYSFEIYLDDMVTLVVASPAILQTDITTGWQPGSDVLSENTDYSWRVRAYDGIDYSNWSGWSGFRVNSMNDNPVISVTGPIECVVDEDGNWSGPSISATDTDGDSLVWSLNIPPEHGQAIVAGTGSFPSTFRYEPSADYYGRDSFDIAVSDGKGGVDTVTIHVTVNPVNDPPENTVLPVLTKTGALGLQLSASPGNWNDSADNGPAGNTVITFEYQWQMADNYDGLNAEVVEGINGSFYVTKDTDNNKYFRVVVTATDDGIGIPATESAVAKSAWILNSVSSNTLPTVPVIESPENDSIVELLAPRLVVNNSTDDDGDTLFYIFEIYLEDGSDDIVMESPEISEGVSVTECQIPDGVLENLNSYYWQVKACDASGCSSWSEKKYFSVDNLIQSSTDTPDSESNGNGSTNCFISTLK